MREGWKTLGGRSWLMYHWNFWHERSGDVWVGSRSALPHLTPRSYFIPDLTLTPTSLHPPPPPTPQDLASPPTLLRPRPHFTPDLHLQSYFTPDLTSPLTSLHSRTSSPILLHPRPYFVPYLTSPSTWLHPRHYFAPRPSFLTFTSNFTSPQTLLRPWPYFTPTLLHPGLISPMTLLHLRSYFTSDFTSSKTLLLLRPYLTPMSLHPRPVAKYVWKASAIDLEVNTISNTNFPGLKEEKLVKLTSFRPREKLISRERERVCVCLCVRVCVLRMCACVLVFFWRTCFHSEMLHRRFIFLYRSPAIFMELDKTEFAFIFALFHWLTLLSATDEGGRETGVPGENPRWQASESTPYWSQKLKAPTGTRTHTITLATSAWKKCKRAHHYVSSSATGPSAASPSTTSPSTTGPVQCRVQTWDFFPPIAGFTPTGRSHRSFLQSFQPLRSGRILIRWL